MDYVQSPDGNLTYTFDWDAVLMGSVIQSYQWTIEPAGPTLTDATAATVYVSGLEAGKVYRLSQQIITSTGIIDERTVTIRGAQR